ncbi:MAG TPA: sigma-70 family RNA polymerase sigma factor [Gemmataceae bacterium]|nr:sigma-70 family RNA polymerase sigma factor [Gemmataceae bacterium]
MNDRDLETRLSVINTHWSLLRQAHGDAADEAERARAELMQRYHGAIYRYLLAGVRDPEAAADLSQEFAVRFLEGRFHKADPTLGRFRDYVKTCLFHLVGDYRRRQGKLPRQAALEEHEPAAPPEPLPEEDQVFRDSWREELLLRAWHALEQVQKDTGQPYYHVLRFRVEHGDLSSQQMAEQLSVELGKPLTAAGVRQILHRSRERFAELLLEEVGRSLGPSGRDYLAEELAELNLLKYCQSALDKRANAE